MKTLSILIATTIDRRDVCAQLIIEFKRQIREAKLENEIQLVVDEDNKEVSVGAKRQRMIETAEAKFVVHFDSDDWPSDKYVQLLYWAIRLNPDIDCIGINVDMTTNGANPQKCCHSFRYPEWKDGPIDGWDYVRNITHFNPVLREKALEIGFKDMRFGEDKEFSDRIYPILKKEFYITEPLFHYRFSNKMNHKEKYYGVK